MSKIEELIKEKCPDGVVYIPIKELAEVGTGSSNRQDESEEGPYPFYVRSKDVHRSNNYLFDETAIIIPGEGGIGDIYHYAQGKYDLHQRAYRIHFIKQTIDPRFAYYYFKCAFKKFIVKKSVSATVTSIRKPMIEDFKIPVPPLEIQQEIVRMLDTFTELEAELEAELTKRKQQYEHYRKQLLDFSKREEVKWEHLENVCLILDNKRKPVTKGDRVGGEYPYYGANGIQDYVSDYIFDGTYVLVGEDGSVITEQYAPVVNWATGKIWVNNHAHILSEKEGGLKLRFIYYYLQTINIKNLIHGNIPKLTGGDLKAISIPVLSEEEQQSIISILDSFYKIAADISEGLPAEIKARHQQYEYYRDKLLTFEEKS